MPSTMSSSHAYSPAQARVLEGGFLTAGFNCVLQMPTGSGKTWLAEQAIADVLTSGRRAIYLTPLRALAAELHRRWQTRFVDHQVGIFTGDFGRPNRDYPIAFRDARLLVMTPERLDACTRAWRTHWNWLPEVDVVVVDELHLLGDPHRGPRLEGTLSRFRRLNPFVRLLGLTATIGNREEIADWLGGVEYVATQRAVPLHWRIVRYRTATEKPVLLAEEIKRTSCQSIVFVQSRRRAEFLSQFLTEQGLSAQHHHAGLAHAERDRVEQDFRHRTVETLVATSTLEMGLNLPARRVILYDLQSFDGCDFTPLSTNSVWQRVGRAGRPGLDTQGEAVLMAPTWDRQVDRYLDGKFEPIRSGLTNSRALAEQILIEIAAGLARSSAQVHAVLTHSLAAHQGILPDVSTVVADMLQSEMICESIDEEGVSPIKRLKATRLGWIAVRHFLTPRTIVLFRQMLISYSQLTFYDLLVLATVTEDCEPVMPVDFEELDTLSARVACEPSHLLQLPHFHRALRISGKRFLAALKMALIARAWTRGADPDGIAKQFDCYPFEIKRLCDSLERLLTGMAAVAEPTTNTLQTDATRDVTLVEKIKTLERMVQAGLDEYAATLMVVAGLGPKTAARLKQLGVHDIEDLALTDPQTLADQPGISVHRATKWVTEAEALVKTHSAYRYRDDGPCTQFATREWPLEVDLYRLRRAFDLHIVRLKPQGYRLTGGLEPHQVRRNGDTLICDCVDAAKGHLCKHLLAVRLYEQDADLKQLVTHLITPEPSTLNLFDLWFER